MTRTDRIKQAAISEIERHRRDIEAERELRSVSVILILPRKRDGEIKVLYRTEAESEFVHEQR